MASPSTICTSCLRVLSRRTSARRNIRSARFMHPSPRLAIVPNHQSLYLDFLAPSALRTSANTSSASKLISPLALRSQHARRTLATTATTTPVAAPAQPIINPRKTEDGKPMLVTISPRASHRLSTIAAADSNPNLALRVTVESGGCHGFQYLISLEDLSKKPATEDDTVFEGAKGAKVIIDETSLELLNGSTVDYTMELIGSQFVVTGIPGATSSCGCGTSFDIQL